jgi:hypothetical protein
MDPLPSFLLNNNQQQQQPHVFSWLDPQACTSRGSTCRANNRHELLAAPEEEAAPHDFGTTLTYIAQ